MKCKETNGLIKRFPVRRGNEFTFVQVGDVDWIEGLGDYAGLHVGGKTHLIRVRVDPSANRDAVLTLRDGKTLRVSRTYRSRLEELLH